MRERICGAAALISCFAIICLIGSADIEDTLAGASGAEVVLETSTSKGGISERKAVSQNTFKEALKKLTGENGQGVGDKLNIEKKSIKAPPAVALDEADPVEMMAKAKAETEAAARAEAAAKIAKTIAAKVEERAQALITKVQKAHTELESAKQAQAAQAAKALQKADAAKVQARQHMAEARAAIGKAKLDALSAKRTVKNYLSPERVERAERAYVMRERELAGSVAKPMKAKKSDAKKKADAKMAAAAAIGRKAADNVIKATFGNDLSDGAAGAAVQDSVQTDAPLQNNALGDEHGYGVAGVVGFF